jgi:Fe-S-cluster containining protein
VAVTSVDVARLAAQARRPACELVAWLAPDAVDMTGEPQSFVELAEGRRLMVLRHEAGACALLGANNRCSAYAERPRDCRAFPFDFERAVASRPDARRLTLLPLDGCEYALDGQNDATALDAADSVRWAELTAYQALVARWNRGAWHRRRLHHRVGDGAAFLEFAFALARASG